MPLEYETAGETDALAGDREHAGQHEQTQTLLERISVSIGGLKRVCDSELTELSEEEEANVADELMVRC